MGEQTADAESPIKIRSWTNSLAAALASSCTICDFQCLFLLCACGMPRRHDTAASQASAARASCRNLDDGCFGSASSVLLDVGCSVHAGCAQTIWAKQQIRLHECRCMSASFQVECIDNTIRLLLLAVILAWAICTCCICRTHLLM